MTAGSRVVLQVDVCSRDVPGHVHRLGTAASFVEWLGKDACLVEVRVPDATLEGDAWYEVLEVYVPEIRVVPDPARGRVGSAV